LLAPCHALLPFAEKKRKSSFAQLLFPIEKYLGMDYL